MFQKDLKKTKFRVCFLSNFCDIAVGERGGVCTNGQECRKKKLEKGSMDQWAKWVSENKSHDFSSIDTVEKISQLKLFLEQLIKV
jgi:hypothetical protein